jgi:GNAT superfamily N-acetyltransferase
MVIQWRLERASVKKHLPQIMRCERTVRHPMSEKGVVSSLRRKYGTGLVCLQEDVLVCGYCLVTLHRYRLELHRLVVAGRHRNAGAGTALVDALKLRVKLAEDRNLINAVVHEEELGYQTWLGARGFRAHLLPHHYGSRDGYEFVWREKWK